MKKNDPQKKKKNVSGLVLCFGRSGATSARKNIKKSRQKTKTTETENDSAEKRTTWAMRFFWGHVAAQWGPKGSPKNEKKTGKTERDKDRTRKKKQLGE